jgi:hypothetical protein
MTSMSITLNILLGQDQSPRSTGNLTVLTNPLVSTVAEPVVSYFDIPLCKVITPVIDLTQDGDVYVEEKEVKEKTVEPEIISNEHIFKETNNERRVKKGFKGVRHVHQSNDDGFKTCPYCDYNTVNGNTLSMHINNSHPEQSGRLMNPHVCSYCNKGFQASTRLAHHIKNHHEITYLKCPIDGCSYQNAKNTTTLAGHIASKHLRHCYDNDTCLTCNVKVGSSIKYHVAFCSQESPLCRNKQ